MMLWWISEFLVSALIFIILGPAVGRWMRARWAPSVQFENGSLENSSIDYILGFTTINFLASFLIPLHQFALPIVILILGLIFWARGPELIRFHWSDGVILIPLLYSMYVLPVTIDSSLREYQFALDHIWWPLALRNHLDVHFAFPSLFHYWSPQVPVMNSLAVQVIFLAFLCWRILVLGLRFLLGKFPTQMGWAFFVILYFGSLFYRKQINGKASPIGGALFFFICVLLATSPEMISSEVILGWLIACTLIFGEFGFLLLIPFIFFYLLSDHPQKKSLLKSLPYSILFMAPEILRKIYEYTGAFGGIFFLSIFLLGLGFWFLKRFSPKIFMGLPEIKNLDKKLFIICICLSVASNIFLSMGSSVEGYSMNLFKWSFGREGAFFAVIIYLLWKCKNSSLRIPFLLFLSIQLINFLDFRLARAFHIVDYINPSEIWWNLQKNAVMISFPLLTTLLGSYFLISFFSKPWTSERWRKVLALAGFLFFIFLQDILIKEVGDGPLSPYAPRLSARASITDMIWEARSSSNPSSKSKNITVWPLLSLPEPDLIEVIRQYQVKSLNPFSVCVDRNLNKRPIGDDDLMVYSIDFLTGAFGHLGDDALCSLSLLSQSQSCKENWREISNSGTARLCESPTNINL
jgi:hypothetical protein